MKIAFATIAVLLSLVNLAKTMIPGDLSNDPSNDPTCVKLETYQEWQTLPAYVSTALPVIRLIERCPTAVATIGINITGSGSSTILLDGTYQNVPFFRSPDAPFSMASTTFRDPATTSLDRDRKLFNFSLIQTGSYCLSGINYIKSCPTAYQTSATTLLCTEWRIPEFGRGWAVRRGFHSGAGRVRRRLIVFGIQPRVHKRGRQGVLKMASKPANQRQTSPIPGKQGG
jgi:hypothetical protein